MKTLLKQRTEEYGGAAWLKARKKYIGASEVATIVGQNPYEQPWKLFAKKTGTYHDQFIHNNRTVAGHMLEEAIANRWKYAVFNKDGSDDPSIFLENWRAGWNLRDCEKQSAVTSYRAGMEYLCATPDRLITKNDRGLSKKGALEIKTISSRVAKMWSEGVPINYVYQCQIQMFVFDLDYVELVILEDGVKFKSILVERDDNIIEALLDEVRSFWIKVIRGNEIQEQLSKKQDGSLQQEYDNLIPDPMKEPPLQFREYLHYRWLGNNNIEVKRDFDTVYDKMQIIKKIDEEMKTLENDKLIHVNDIIEDIEDINKVTYPDNSYVIHKQTKSGRAYFKINVSKKS